MQVFDRAALKELRQEKGYTQKALGVAIGTKEQHIQQWEYGARQPTANYLLRMMVLLDCSAADLLMDDPT